MSASDTETSAPAGQPFTQPIQSESDRAGYLRKRHWEMLVASVVILILSAVFQLNASGSVEAPIGGGVSLPPLCMSRAWFGYECPGCGLTRSFVALAAGDLAESLAFHRIGWLMAAAVAVQIPYRVSELSGRSWPISDRAKDRFGKLLIVSLLGNWVFKLFGY